MYMSMLSCARNQGLVPFAEKIIQRLESIQKFRSEELKPAYVLLGNQSSLRRLYFILNTYLANLYNAQGHREDAFRIRQKMREKKLTKVPGRTWIDIDGITHEFHANEYELFVLYFFDHHRPIRLVDAMFRHVRFMTK